MSPRRPLGAFCALLCLLASASADAAKRRKPPVTATLEVTSSITGASVFVDSNKVGETPLRGKHVKAGAATVSVRKLGHLEFSERVELRAGQTLKVFADLLPFAGVVKVSANVPGAKVAVDGKVVGTAPLEYEVKIGTRVVTVSAAGHNSVTQTIRADPGSTYVVDAKLASGAGAGALSLDGEALVPLEAMSSAGPGTSQPTGGLELPLEPMGDAPPDVALEAMPSLELLAPPRVAATDPNRLRLEAASGGVAAESPWYKRWYTWTAVGAVVVAGATTAVLLSREEQVRDTTLDWRVGEGDGQSHIAAAR